MNYEDAMKELNQIIEKLESGQCPLSLASDLFDKGAALCEFLNAEMEKTGGKITVIREKLGKLIEEDL